MAKIPYRDAQDGISLTTTLLPEGLGRIGEDRVTNLTGILDAGGFGNIRRATETPFNMILEARL